MKKSVYGFLILIFCMYSSGYAQEFTYSLGIKGGVNYSLGGHIIEGRPDDEPRGPQYDAQSKIGYLGGVFAQANLGRLFLRPEITYASIKTGYEFPLAETEHHVTKFDIPVLLGYNVFGPLDIYAGPVYSNISTSNIEVDPSGEEFRVVVQSSPGVNLHAGLKFDLGRFEIDLRYERTLDAPDDLHTYPSFDPIEPLEDGSTTYYGVEGTTIADPRIHQVILAVSFKIFGTDFESNSGRRGGDWCY